MRHAATVAAMALMAASAWAAVVPGTWNSDDNSDLLTGTWTEIYGAGGPGQPGATLTAEAPDGMPWSLGGIYIVTGATVYAEDDETITYRTEYYNESDPGASMLELAAAPTLWEGPVTFTNLQITVLATINKSNGTYARGTFTGSATTVAGLTILIEGSLTETGQLTEPDPGHEGDVDYIQVTILPIDVPLDIKPGSCPNAFNPQSKGVLPVALLGSEGFDVTMIDPTTIKLVRADDPEGAYVEPLMGPPGPGIVYEDVAAPFDGEPCECGPTCPDGYVDLTLKFAAQDVAELGPFEPGSTVELLITGNLSDDDGTPFEARDCVWVVPAAKTMQVQLQSQSRNAGLGNFVK